MILLSYFSPLLCSNDFPKSWFSNETGDFRDKRTCASCQPLFVRERNMKRSHAFWGKTVRSVSCQWRASLRSHPTLPPPRNLGTGLCCLQPPNGRRHCWFHCRNERRESGIYLKYGLSLRLVAFFFFFFFRTQNGKRQVSPIAAARFYDGKVNSLLDDIPFVLLARRFVAACVRLHQRFPFAIRGILDG